MQSQIDGTVLDYKELHHLNEGLALLKIDGYEGLVYYLNNTIWVHHLTSLVQNLLWHKMI